MKKFIEFINELNYSTYRSASIRLKELGHDDRSENIEKHANTHHIELDRQKNYGDLMPFELVGSFSSYHERYESGREDLITAYLAGWIHIPMEDIDYELVSISPYFIYNTKQPYIEKSNELNKEHIKGLDNVITSEHIFTLEFEVANEEVSIYSYEGNSKNDFIKFSNRRDAVRFKKILEEDSLFLDTLIEMTQDNDDISPFYVKKKFIESYNINNMYYSKK